MLQLFAVALGVGWVKKKASSAWCLVTVIFFGKYFSSHINAHVLISWKSNFSID